DLGAQRGRIEIAIVAGNAFELAVEHADDLGGFVVDDALRLSVPQRRHRDLASIALVGRGIGLVQVMEAIDGIRRAIRKRGIALECPALLLETRDGVGDRDRLLELLQRAIDQGAMRPRAAVRDVEVVAARLGLEAGRAVGRDAIAKPAVGAAELADAADFLGKLFVAPNALDQEAHVCPSKACKHASAALDRVKLLPALRRRQGRSTDASGALQGMRQELKRRHLAGIGAPGLAASAAVLCLHRPVTRGRTWSASADCRLAADRERPCLLRRTKRASAVRARGAIMPTTARHPENVAIPTCGMAVMAKASVPGRTKTRVGPPLTPVPAARLDTALVDDIAPH